ncbi:MAG: alkane 1-monooxygenase [Burkholderiaceae bacterium]|nr:alkane 1-monooxygenase [Burkholderiaceae bacterium]
MTRFPNNALSAAFERQWVAHKKYWYLTSLILPCAPLLSAWLAVHFKQGAWLWLVVVLAYIAVPLLDALFGEDTANPSDEQIEQLKNAPYYDWLLYGAAILHWAALVGMAYTVAHWSWSWFDILGAGLGAGLVNGIALTIGHELAHKMNNPRHTLAGKLALACCGYGHFIVDHNKGHHKDVATPEDIASSRMGETIYAFACRELPGALKRAMGIEAERLQRMGKPWWSPSNEILQQWAFALAAYGAMLACWGVRLLPFLLLAAFYGWWQLTSANYVEHYGLLRQKDEKNPNRYQRCEPRHSWNTNLKVSNLILLHLQRHSDHHAHPTRAYQALRDYRDVPQLPFDYFAMFMLALVPPLWFAVMNPRVAAWAGNDMDKVNLAPQSREAIFHLYHRPAA